MYVEIVVLDLFQISSLDPDHGREALINRSDANQARVIVDNKEAANDRIWVVIVVK